MYSFSIMVMIMIIASLCLRSYQVRCSIKDVLEVTPSGHLYQ